jgi:hypothetical protein
MPWESCRGYCWGSQCTVAQHGRCSEATLLATSGQRGRVCLTSLITSLPNEFIPDTNEFIPDTNEFIPDTNEFIPDTNEFIPDTVTMTMCIALP